MRILMTGTSQENDVLVFDVKIFRILLFGGICEFLGSTLVLFSYRSALSANINQGICSAILTVNGILVTIASYLIYRERMYCVQFLGICTILASFCLIVAF